MATKDRPMSKEPVRENLSERERKILGNDVVPVSKEEFSEKLFSIRPHGNIEDAYIWTCYAIRHIKDFKGQPVTFEVLVQRFSSYIASKRREAAEARYIRTLSSWIENGGYNIEDEGPDEVFLKYAK